MESTHRHDFKCSPLRIRRTGYNRRVAFLPGLRARKVSVCVGCGCLRVAGGTTPDGDYRPHASGSAREVLNWIESKMDYSNPKYVRVATMEEVARWGASRCLRMKLLPPMAGGASRYFVGSGTNWSSTTSWSTTTGGASGAAVPTAADDVHFDASSPGNCTIDLAASCLSLDCTGFTHTLTHNSAVTLTVAGSSFKLVSGMVYTRVNATSALVFTQSSAGTVTITGGNQSLGNVTTASGLTSSSAVYQLQDSSILGAGSTWTHTAGTLDLNNLNHSWGILVSSNTNVRTLTLGSGTLTLTGTGTVFSVGTSTNLTVTATAGTITVSDTSATGKTVRLGLMAFGNLTVTGGGTGAVTFGDSGTLSTLTLGAPKTITFTASQTITVSNLVAWGSSGNLITCQSSSAGTPWTISCSSRTYIWCDWLSLKDSTASGTTLFYAGADSTNVSGNTGWIFSSWAIPLAAASISSAVGSLTAATRVPLATSSSTSAASASLTATTQVVLSGVSSTSTSSMSLTAATEIPLSAAASASSGTLALGAPTRVVLGGAASVSSASGHLGVNQPDVVEYYLLGPAYASSLVGMSTSFAGSPVGELGGFDVIAAIALANSGGRFAVCDNALKDVLRKLPQLTRTSGP